uniref:Putative tRNA(His) guanylyltransferase n=1 Tax=Lygus hesperus TaxID=30085 RepID=A0A0A9WGQ6_LYGHE
MLYNTCYWKLRETTQLSQQEIESTLRVLNSSEKHELLFSRYQINYAKLPSVYRRGSVLYRSYTDSTPHCGCCCNGVRVPKNLHVSHCDVIHTKFWHAHQNIIPYVSPATLQRTSRQARKLSQWYQVQDGSSDEAPCTQ